MLTDLRHLFEVDDEVVYLNAPSMSPLLRSVRVAGEQALARRARPWTIRPPDWFTEVERLRGLAAGLLGTDADHVALVPSSSYGLAVAAHNLPAGPGQRVVVLDHEFPSSFHTWQAFTRRTGAELVRVERGPDQSWTDAVEAAVDERTAIVVSPNVHWTNGALVDLPAVANRARVAGAARTSSASISRRAPPSGSAPRCTTTGSWSACGDRRCASAPTSTPATPTSTACWRPCATAFDLARRSAGSKTEEDRRRQKGRLGR